MRSRAKLLMLALAPSAAMIASCGLMATGCKAYLSSVLQVDVFDSLTNAPAAGGATVWVRGDGFADSVTVPDTVQSEFAHLWTEARIKAGTYSVQVQKSGYRTWTRDDIRVRANSCHVTTFEHLIARLQR